MIYTYDRLEHIVNVTSGAPNALILYTYNNKHSYVQYKQTNVGEMNVDFMVSAPGFNSTYGTIHFVINKAQLDVNIIDPLDIIYTGYTHTYNAVITPFEDLALNVTYMNKSHSYDIAAPTTVGQYSMVRYVSTLFWINFC